jgi:hypothetical protein
MTLERFTKAMQLYGITEPPELERLYALALDVGATIRFQMIPGGEVPPDKEPARPPAVQKASQVDTGHSVIDVVPPTV